MPGSELKTNARKIMHENAPAIFILSAIFVIVTTVMSELEFRLPGLTSAYDQLLERLSSAERPTLGMFFPSIRPVGAILSVVLLIVTPVVEIGYMNFCLKMERGSKCDYKDILDGFLFFGKTILLSIVIFIFTFLWSLLFIFPGIAAYYRYRQAYYILLDSPDKGIMTCIRESKQLMAGNKLDLFLVDFSFLGWSILNLIVMMIIPTSFSLPLVSIWIAPYHGLTCAAFYNKLVSRVSY